MTFAEAVLLALVVGLIGIVGTIVGQELADRSARRRAAADRAHALAREAADRIRAAILRDLDETRQVLVGNLSYLEKTVVLRLPDVRLADTSALTRYNINLVGDVDALRTYDDLTRELAGRLPLTVPAALGQVVRQQLPRKSQIDPDLVNRTTRTRAVILAALDAQEQRALRDEPLRVVTADELATIGGADAMLDVLSERLGRPRQKPPSAE